MRREELLLCGGLGLMAAMVGIGAWPVDRGPPRRAVPATLDGVAALAAARGLYHFRDGAGGVRLVVSVAPLTAARVGSLRMAGPPFPGWIGTAAVYANGHAFADSAAPGSSAFWGRYFLYGDPEVIARLTGGVP